MSQGEIVCKAKRTDNGEWVEGVPTYPEHEIGKCYMITRVHGMDERFGYGNSGKVLLIHGAYEVDPETVCRYAGLTDKNEKKIFESDILRISKKSDGMGGYYFPLLECPVNVSVKFDLCAYMLETIGDEKYYISFPDAWCHYECEVIGNIHDN